VIEEKTEETALKMEVKKLVVVALVIVAYEVLRPPLESIVKRDDEATLRSSNVPVNPEVASAAIRVPVVPPATESLAKGEVVPKPKLPEK